MSKINETIVMMAEQKEQFEINGKKFQIIEVKEAEQQPDYSHLVGKWVKCVDSYNGLVSIGKWYHIEQLDYNSEISVRCNNGNLHSCSKGNSANFFDLSNPSDTNPDEKTVWEKANEAMWKYGGGQRVASMDFLGSPDGFQDHFDKQWKHIRAYLFLSKFADLCNEGRVVDFVNEQNHKHTVYCESKYLLKRCKTFFKSHIAFLDKEARDYSLKVHEQIWKDYWGIEQ